MRIAVVGPTYPFKGGGAQHTTELAHRLAGSGHDVVLESWSRQFPARLYPGEPTIDEPEVPLFPRTRHELSWRRPDGWPRLGRRLARSVDAVVLSVLTPVQVAAYLGILWGARGAVGTTALCHNVLPHERRAFDVPLMRALLRRVDAVVVHSEEQARLARSLSGSPVWVAGLPPHLPAAIGPAADRPGADRPGAGPPDVAVPAAAGPAAAYRPSEPRRRLLFFGFVRPYKGLDVLLRALARGPGGVSLQVAGEFWSEVAETERLVAALGLAGRVTLRPGYVRADELPSLFAGVDALVLPYRSATSTQNGWLAHQYGVPVIATRTGTLPGQVRDGVDGLLCEPDSVDDLARALERFYTGDEPRRLRANVLPVDPDPYWRSYLETLGCALSGG